MNSSFNDFKIDRSKYELPPICPNCGDKLVAKIGTAIIISPNCNIEFQLISLESRK